MHLGALSQFSSFENLVFRLAVSSSLPQMRPRVSLVAARAPEDVLGVLAVKGYTNDQAFLTCFVQNGMLHHL